MVERFAGLYTHVRIYANKALLSLILLPTLFANSLTGLYRG